MTEPKIKDYTFAELDKMSKKDLEMLEAKLSLLHKYVFTVLKYHKLKKREERIHGTD